MAWIFMTWLPWHVSPWHVSIDMNLYGMNSMTKRYTDCKGQYLHVILLLKPPRTPGLGSWLHSMTSVCHPLIHLHVTCICTFIWTCTCNWIYIFTCICVCVFTCISICICICICISICFWILDCIWRLVYVILWSIHSTIITLSPMIFVNFLC